MAEWQAGGAPDRLDTRQPAQTREDRAHGFGARFIVRERDDLHVERHDSIRRESGIHACQLDQAAADERGAGEHDGGERDLRDDEPAAQAARAPRLAGTAVLLERGAGPLAAGLERGDRAEEQRDEQRDPRGERQHRGLQPDDRHLRHVFEQERGQRLDRPHRRHETDDAADRCDDHAFDQELAQDPPARRSQRGAGGDLARAAGRPREQQVRRVRARDQQEKADRRQRADEHRTDVSDDRVAQRPVLECNAGVRIRIGAGERRGDRVRFLLRHGQRHARPEARDMPEDAQRTRGWGGSEANVERRPDLEAGT